MRELIPRAIVRAIAVTSGLVFVSACNSAPAPPAAEAPSPPAASAIEPYVPGLGEIMSLQQMRHTKLWFAGQAGNWPLAEYELEEIGEGFDDVVKFYPTHKDSPVSPSDAIPRMVAGPLAELRQAVEKRDAAAFGKTYDGLTESCNRCHDAMNFGFNRVQRPATNPYPNQIFEPAQR